MPFLGELSALSAAALWAATSMLYASVTTKIGSVQTNISRMIVATVLLIGSILFFNIPINLSSTQIQNLVISAVMGLVFGDTFLFKAFQQIGARVSMLVMTSSPPIAAILAYFFLGEALSSWGVAGILLTLSGISIVVLKRTPQTARYKITKIGLLYAFFGAFGQGSGVIFVKMAFIEGPIHGIVAACIRLGVAVLILLPPAIATGRYSHPVKIFAHKKKVLVYLLFGSFIGTYLGLTLSLVAIAHAKVGIASTLVSTSPVIMLPLVRIAYKETLSWKAILGAFVAVGGVAILFLM